MKRKEEYQFDLVASIIKLEDTIKEYVHEDELTGDYLVIPVEDIQRVFSAVRTNLRWALDVEMNRKGKRFRPLRELMINYFKDMNYGAGSVDVVDSEDNNGETTMGKTCK